MFLITPVGFQSARKAALLTRHSRWPLGKEGNCVRPENRISIQRLYMPSVSGSPRQPTISIPLPRHIATTHRLQNGSFVKFDNLVKSLFELAEGRSRLWRDSPASGSITPLALLTSPESRPRRDQGSGVNPPHATGVAPTPAPASSARAA